MKVEVFNFRAFDTQNGTNVVIERPATREFIAKVGDVIEESRREVDEALLNAAGQVWLMPNPDEFRILLALVKMRGEAVLSGNPDTKPYERLEDAGYVVHVNLNVSTVVYTITDRGRLALEQLR